MIAPACMVWVSRIEERRCGRCRSFAVHAYFVAIGEEDGKPLLLDTRTGEPWAGEFTEEEQAEADAWLERDREMRRLDMAWKRAA